MASKPGSKSAFVLFDVIYSDGSRRSNRKVPAEILGGLDGDEPARKVIEEQDNEIAKASGSLQLIAGQVADLEGEGRKISRAQLRYIHERKTSALLACSVRLGGMSANCTPAQLEALTDFGYHVGLAFQVIDDILDVTQTSEQLGKTAGKDVKAGKATYPSLVGLEKSRAIAAELTAKAEAALKPFRGRAVALEAISDHLLRRQS